MEIILVFVSTLDGKITRWDDPHVNVWSSKEDQTYFKKTWREAKLLVMGSSTFRASPITATPNHLLVVLTSKPEDYEKYRVPGQLEFTSESPTALVARYNKAGYERMFMVGGAHAATSFLKEKLIDEVWLTIEPKIFGVGSNFAVGEKLDVTLQLLTSETINEQGTLILKYRVVKV